MTNMKTFLGAEIPKATRGLVYLCNYDHRTKTMKVVRTLLFANGSNALNAYANIPNPESQLAMGNDRESFEKDLNELHTNLRDPEWVKELAEYL